MAEIKLNVFKREVFGRKLKAIRSQGLIPANIYGKKTKSIAVSVGKDELLTVYKEAGETGIVKVTIEGEKESRPVLMQNFQRNPVSEEILHADLRQVVLTEKITAMIPIELTGESPVVAQKQGILIQPTSEIEVEALPLDLPEKFVLDVTGLANVGDSLMVSDIKYDKKTVELKVEESLVIAKIEPLAAEEVAPEPAEGAEGETEGSQTVPAEGGETQTGGNPPDGESAKDDKAPEGEFSDKKTPA